MSATRIILRVAAVLVSIAGFQLFVLGEHTDAYFAWTIKSPITAAFIGAAYWSSLPIVLGGVRGRVWAQTRISYFSPLVFTVSMLIATAMHLDALHLHQTGALFPVFAAWSWVAVYFIVPVAEIVILGFQLRAPGGDPPRIAPMPVAIRAIILAQAAIMLLIGAVLFVAPLAGAGLWPWKLTAFTAQVTGGWLLGLGVAGAEAVWENDWTRVTAAVGSYLAFGVLQAVVLLRYGASLGWGGAGLSVYTAFIASIVIVAVWAELAARQAAKANA